MAKFICGLNLRTDRLSVSLARVDKYEIQDVSSDYCLSKGIDTKGVTNISVLIDALKNVTGQLKNLYSDVKINNIFVSLDSVFIKKVVGTACIPLLERGSKIINNSDIKKVTSHARAFAQRLDDEIIYHYPLDFIVDDQIVTKNPQGLYAHKLEIRLLCLLVSRNLLDNITYAFRCAGFDVGSFIYSPLSSSLNIKEDRRRNCVLIDFGIHTTDIVLFKDGLLEDMEILKIGGHNITQALASAFDISLELAQELRDTHAVLDIDSLNNEEVLIRKSDSYQPIKRSNLTRIATYVFKGQFEEIKSTLLKYKYPRAAGNLFAAGDDILLDGFLEMFSKEIDTPVQMLTLTNNIKSKHKGHPNLYSSSLGAVKFALSDSKNKGSVSVRGKNLMRKGAVYIKDLYQEYF